MILEPKKVSVDMIDFTIEITTYWFERRIKNMIDTLANDSSLKHWENFQWNRYRHNWTWEVERVDEYSGEFIKYSFYFAYRSNIKGRENKFRLSYNPNKVPSDDRVLSYLLYNVMLRDDTLRVESVDIAFDYMGVTTSDLIFDKGCKREYKVMKYPGSDRTYTIGKRGEDGYVKVYDKASEEFPGVELDYNKTRYEITWKLGINLWQPSEMKFKSTIPTLYINSLGLFGNKKLKPTDKLLIYSIENGFPMDELTYEQKKRYSKLMDEISFTYTKIEPTQLAVESALTDFISSLLTN